VEGSHVGDCFYRLDLRSPASQCGHAEGGHPLMLRAITASKKKNERIDAHKIADGLRCDFLPESYMASTEIRERRRTVRYGNLLVRQAVQTKNKIAVLLMEADVNYKKQGCARSGISENRWL
jgi:transposase